MQPHGGLRAAGPVKGRPAAVPVPHAPGSGCLSRLGRLKKRWETQIQKRMFSRIFVDCLPPHSAPAGDDIAPSTFAIDRHGQTRHMHRMQPSSSPTIVFDLDGTLAETAPDIIGTLNVVLAQEGLAPLPVSKARDLVGAGAKALIDRGFKVYDRPLTPERLEDLFQHFLEIYAGRVADESHLYDGVLAAMDRLDAAGHRLAVCTNKPIRHSRLILDAFGITQRFAAVAGRDSFPFFKPDARHLTHTISAAGGDVARAIMIGDSRTDILTARNAGLPVICVPFGYTDVPIETLEPDVVIQHFAELPAAVAAVSARMGWLD